MSPHGATTVDLGGVPVRVELRVLDDVVLVGGPLEVEVAVHNDGDRAVDVPVGADRGRGRPGHVSFSAQAGGAVLTDPRAGLPYRGGLSGKVTLAPGDRLAQRVLVNDFLGLDVLRTVVAPAARLSLALRCLRNLATGAQPDPVTLAGGQDVAVVELDVAVLRDDDALAALASALGDELGAGGPASVEDRERQVGRLAAIGLPDAAAALEALAGGRDEHLAGLAAQARHRLGPP
ncbi:hypothetical protein [Cellulomonas sp. URHB0016]